MKRFHTLAILAVTASIGCAAYADNERWKSIYDLQPTYTAFGLEMPTWTKGSPEAERAWDRCLIEMSAQLQANMKARSCRRL